MLDPGTTGNAEATRPYGWLMPAYQDPGNSLRHQHLPHRDRRDLAEVTNDSAGLAGKTAPPSCLEPVPALMTAHSGK
jgi:hypothetical protein